MKKLYPHYCMRLNQKIKRKISIKSFIQYKFSLNKNFQDKKRDAHCASLQYIQTKN